jgi:hypothetical protein
MNRITEIRNVLPKSGHTAGVFIQKWAKLGHKICRIGHHRIAYRRPAGRIGKTNQRYVNYLCELAGSVYSRSRLPYSWLVAWHWPKPSANPQILDSRIMDIRPASRREDLTPVFGFNSKGL